MHLFDRRTILSCTIILLGPTYFPNRAAVAQQAVFTRGSAAVVLQAFAPNIVRVTLSLDKAAALKYPGVGIIATGVAADGSRRAWTVATPFVPIIWWFMFHLKPMGLPQAHRRI